MKGVNRLKYDWGKFPLCNNKKDRAPHIFGRCFLLCWRCTMVMFFSIITTIILCYLDLSLFLFNNFRLIGVILIIPMILDGGMQYFIKRDSNNFRRAITGALFGIGIAIITNF